MNTFRVYKLTGIMILLLLSSCKKFLEKNPLDAISSASFWNTDNDAQLALTGCYATLYASSNALPPLGWARPYFDCLADNGFSQWGCYNWCITTISTGDLNPSTGGLSPDLYRYYYKGIATFNYFWAILIKLKVLMLIKRICI
ncbi:MAG: hypothetical protein WKG06_09740 [Segetibacter sp.]